MQVSVIGAGLAGCEAAWQLARRGIAVTLYEMKPAKRTPAHHSNDFAELCCSNSLRSDQLENAVGLLKEELRRLGSLILACADETRVEAGGALAVDRHGFARLVTARVRSHPNITVIESEVTSIPAEGTVIVASGPLTSDALAEAIRPAAVVCCASSDRRYSSACPDTLKLLADCGAKLYFSDCPPVPGMSVPPHQALAFTVGSAGALEARYVPVV